MDAFFGAVVVFAACAWVAWCNHRAFNQRMELRMAIAEYARGEHWPVWVWQDFERTSYDAHMLMLLTFRDWRKVYSPRLRAALPEIFGGTEQ